MRGAGAEGARPGRARPAAIGRASRIGVESRQRVESLGARRGPAVAAAVRRASSQSAEPAPAMREIVHIQAGQCGNQIGTKVGRAPGFLRVGSEQA